MSTLNNVDGELPKLGEKAWRHILCLSSEIDVRAYVQCLYACHIIDKVDESKSVIHGWSEVAGKIRKKLSSEALRQRKRRQYVRVTENQRTEYVRGDKEKEKEKEKDIKTKSAATPLGVPDDLVKFQPVIEKWIKHKRESGKSYKPTGLTALWNKMRELGDGLPAAVEHSIANNYQGIYPPRGGTGPPANRIRDWTPAESTDDYDKLQAEVEERGRKNAARAS